jgi:hypothetical protein
MSLPQIYEHIIVVEDTLELSKMDSKPGYSQRPLGSSALLNIIIVFLSVRSLHAVPGSEIAM